MKRVLLYYLQQDGEYTDGCEIVEKDAAVMPPDDINYFLQQGKSDGVDYGFDTDYTWVSDEEAVSYERRGYTVTDN